MAARALSVLTSKPSSFPSPTSKNCSVRLSSSLLSIPLARPLLPRASLRSSASVVVSILPTAKPDRAAAEQPPSNGDGHDWGRWSSSAIKSFSMGELEARKLKYPNTGTEALLMGILVEGTNEAAKFLRADGITLYKVREDTMKLLGKSDMFFFSPEHPPLTEPAQRALDWAIDKKLKSGEDGEITTIHMLLGIWSEKESAGHKILASLGFDDRKATELAKLASKDLATKISNVTKERFRTSTELRYVCQPGLVFWS